VAMVSQSFALFAWLTVEENAELGLYARGLPKEVGEKEALDTLGVVGLEGFEGAYAKELSGGIGQREPIRNPNRLGTVRSMGRLRCR
jgi:NitT/TauT family transport system ATP-binding protein